MITQQVKEKADKLIDNGEWLKLFMLILEVGKELMKYINERKKAKKDARKNNKKFEFQKSPSDTSRGDLRNSGGNDD